MKSIHKAFLIFLILAFNCARKQDSEYAQEITDADSAYLAKTISKNLIEGIWAEYDTTIAFFLIRDDSVYYVEALDEPVPFEISGDTLLINYDGFITRDLIIKLDKDSLILWDENNEFIRLYRR